MRKNEPINLNQDEFKIIGHELIERLAAFFDTMPKGQVTPGEFPFHSHTDSRFSITFLISFLSLFVLLYHVIIPI